MAEHGNGQDQDTRRDRSDGFERITPQRIEPGRTAAAPQRAGADKTLPAAVVWIGLGLLVLLGGALLLWLSQRPAAVPVAAEKPAPVATDAPEQKPAPPDADALLAAREQAQTLGDKLSRQREALQKQAVARWASTQAERLADSAEQGQQRFNQRDYSGASEAYRSGLALAEQLTGRVPGELADALKRGKAALDAGNRAQAQTAFELALAIDPGHVQAKRGLARAKTLDELRALLASGREHEQAGKLAQARADYQRALQLDAASDKARQALARVGAELGERAFSQHMSTGLAALERGDYAAAREAFQAAARQRPGSGEAADGLARARAGLQARAVDRHREQASENESQERWQAALDAYQAALAIDPSLSFAQAGAERARRRAELDERLGYHLAHAQRLSAASVRHAVTDLLARARQAGPPNEKLNSQADQLAQLLADAQQPVTVRLRSDNRTEVLVYHVGRLGRFESKQLRLLPGEYTAVGRCEGYRDVRLEFTVSADQPAGPISIRCQEKI